MIAIRKRRRDDEGGFALIFALLVITLITATIGTMLFIATPQILNGKQGQDTTEALNAAQAGIDDAVAYLESVPSCRSETQVCAKALGASSAALAGTSYQRPTLGTAQSFSWTTASKLTTTGTVRLTSVGSFAGTSKTLVADLALQPSLLTYGYWTNYESQSPASLSQHYSARNIYLSDSSTTSNVNIRDTSGYSLFGQVSSPTTATWNGPPSTGSNPNPVSTCGQHWYSEGQSSPGRYLTNSQWGETGSIKGRSIVRNDTCDLVFTSANTQDGPVYTRDALDIAEDGNGGPMFTKPVYTLWGYGSNTTPTAPNGAPYRQNSPGDTVANGSYVPTNPTTDITLSKTLGMDGVPANACIYHGPTRVVLNGDGTATITSPETTVGDPAADSGCYPSASAMTNGIYQFTLDYNSVGAGAIYVKNGGTMPASGWPESSLKSTSTPSAGNEIMYIPATSGGATQPDQFQAAAQDNCGSSSVSNAWYAPCGWTNVASPTDGNSAGLGWTSYTSTKCSSAAPTDRELFECEYSGKSGSTTLQTNQSGGYYDALRTIYQSDLASAAGVSCGLNTSQSAAAACFIGLLNADLAKANTSGHSANYAKPANGDHQYVAQYVPSLSTSATQSPNSVGSAPTNPTAGDSMFTYAGTPAQETQVHSTVVLQVKRQTWSSGGWSAGTNAFGLGVTYANAQLTQQASGASYFPNPLDVTRYATGADASGNAAGSNGVNQPGDLYVEGTNSGKLSLLAQNNVEITDDITDSTTDTSTDAVSITAGNNVRNYHPVQCVDQTAADINSTSPNWCPNDLTGLTTNSLISYGQFTSAHPAAQYSDVTATGNRRIDAAIFALNGSFGTDNWSRGTYMGKVTVNGGIYQNFRGVNSVYWGTGTLYSGFTLNTHYVDLSRASLPYAPAVSRGDNPRVWNATSISAG